MTSAQFHHRFLQLYGLLVFAFSQPLFELLRQNTAFLSAHGLDRLDLFLLAAVISLLPAVVVFVLLAPASALGARASTAAFFLLAAVSASGVLWMGVKDLTSLALGLRVAASAAFGLLTAWLLLRWEFAAYLGRVLAVAGIVFPVLFLLDPRVAALYSRAETQPESPAKLERRPPIVFVVLDELPLASLLNLDLTINAERYPNFAALASTSTWYRNASTVADGTIYSIPALLTGRRSKTRGAPTLGLYPENLFTWLRDDYRITSVEWVTRLCPDGVCEEIVRREIRFKRWVSTLSDLRVLTLYSVAPPELTKGLPVLSGRWKGFGQSEPEDSAAESSQGGSSQPAIDEFEGLTNSIDDRDGALYFLHARLPHVPWEYLPSGRYYGRTLAIPPGVQSGEMWGDSELLTVQGFQRHLLQLQYTDRLLGRLLERLKKSRVWDRALFILAADHGASFLPNVSRRHVQPENFAAILSIPLFIKTPGQQTGRIDDRVVETIDVLPTIADVLGAPWPWKFDGRSLLDASYTGRTERLVTVDAPFRFEVYPGKLPLEPILNRKVALFGTGEDPDRFFRAGPMADLVGKSVDEFPRGPSPAIRAELDQSSLYEVVDPNGERIPALIRGHVQGTPSDKPLRLAIAVNGRISAVTDTFNNGGGVSAFAALVPKDAFLPGENDVRVFLVSSDAPIPQLIPLSQDARRWTFHDNDSQLEIVSDAGERVRVGSNEISGTLDQVVHRGDWIEFSGWAGDLSSGRPVQVVLFIDGRSRYATSTRYERKDVAQFFKRDDLLISGFTLTAPAQELTANDPAIRLIAICDDGAAELRYRADTHGLRLGTQEQSLPLQSTN